MERSGWCHHTNSTNRLLSYHSLSSELVLSFFSNPYWVSLGEELRLWYGEDFVDHNEYDNEGKACSDVYALYV